MGKGRESRNAMGNMGKIDQTVMEKYSSPLLERIWKEKYKTFFSFFEAETFHVGEESLPCVLGLPTAQAVLGTDQKCHSKGTERINPTLIGNITFGFETSFC